MKDPEENKETLSEEVNPVTALQRGVDAVALCVAELW
jgi:hypothetical protein